MREINLLPWRKTSIIRYSLATVLIQFLLLSIVIVFCVSIRKITLERQQTIAKEQQALAPLQQQWQRKRLADDTQQQRREQQKRINAQFSTFVYLAQHLPAQSHLQSIRLNAQNLTLTGVAKNQPALNAVAALSKNFPYYTEQKQWQVSYHSPNIHFLLELTHD